MEFENYQEHRKFFDAIYGEIEEIKAIEDDPIGGLCSVYEMRVKVDNLHRMLKKLYGPSVKFNIMSRRWEKIFKKFSNGMLANYWSKCYIPKSAVL